MLEQLHTTRRDAPTTRWAMLGATLALLALALSVAISVRLTPARAAMIKQTTPVAAVNQIQFHLDIFAPMTTASGATMGPMYAPTTSLVAPAHTLVTMTIVNHDLGDTPLGANSPYTQVSNVTDGVARVDGVPFTQIDQAKVAHTFTIPQLGVNVPIPGDSATGQASLTVTFSFMTGAAGVYDWRCMDPCGSGPGGWQGPMATMGQMMGTLTVTG